MGTQSAAELPLFTHVTVTVPTIKLMQPDGSVLVKVGKPVIADPEVSVSEAAELLGLSTRHIEYQCSVGLFESAYKPGGRPRSKWKISREEVMRRKQPPLN